MPRRNAWKKIYGSDGEIVPRLDRARVVLSIDSDFMASDGAALENIRAFTAGRTLDDSNHADAQMSRLYVAESTMTLTGSNADHRIRLRPSLAAKFARALLGAVEGNGSKLDAFAHEHRLDDRTLASLADDLSSNHGASLVLAGSHLPEPVHAAVALLNESLDSWGKTMEWNSVPSTLEVSDQAEVEDFLGAGVDVVICMGVNPVYDWPGGNFGTLLEKVKLSVGHGMYQDETLTAGSLALASNHYLESWNDAQPRSGMKTLCQPVIAPLFDTRQEAESLLIWTRALAGESETIAGIEDWHDYLRRRWEERVETTGSAGEGNSSRVFWEESLRVGMSIESAGRTIPELDGAAARRLAGEDEDGGEFDLVIHPHHSVYDGRFANNGWMQELPDPVSKMVWGNAAAISSGTAGKLGVTEGDMLEISSGDRSVMAPALIQPGTAEGTVAITLGHGRSEGGVVARDAGGANASLLLGRENRSRPRLAFKATLARAEGSRKIVRTQKQFSMHDRPIVLDGDLEQYRKEADFVKHLKHTPESADLYEEVDYSRGHKWAMSIDMNACVGCGGCMTACQAENNIPIVGREQCDKGREMHWIRIDRYHDGDADNPTVHHQPMLCQHCDNAPCENVCPVNATTHSPEGLNEMTYNRCVGTRYCANNCPYKVRRFNFLRYQDEQLRDPFQELMFNPQVTVRGVGVMEKCTFCVQRINEAKFRGSDGDGKLPDGAITTACQQACPAQAITFGDANDGESRLVRASSSARSFHVLEELNIKPSVTYLAKVRNPNPKARTDKDGPVVEHEA